MSACRRAGVRFSVTARKNAGIHKAIEAIGDDAWTPIPYWNDGGADVAQTTYTAFAGTKHDLTCRLLVRQVRPTPGSQLADYQEGSLDLAVRGGGHSVPGFGTGDDALVIDLSMMKGVRVDPQRRTARAEGGCTWGDLDHATHSFGLATSGGSSRPPSGSG